MMVGSTSLSNKPWSSCSACGHCWAFSQAPQPKNRIDMTWVHWKGPILVGSLVPKFCPIQPGWFSFFKHQLVSGRKRMWVIFSTPHLPHCSPVRPCSTIPHLNGWRYSDPNSEYQPKPCHGKEQNPPTYRYLRRFGHPTLDRLRELQIIYNHPGLDRMLDNRSNLLKISHVANGPIEMFGTFLNM